MKRVYIALAVLAVALVGVIGWQVVKPSGEPHYQGRSLTYWIRSYRRDQSGVQLIASPEELATADNAVRHIGTNAFPYLLKWLAYAPTRGCAGSRQYPAMCQPPSGALNSSGTTSSKTRA